MRLALATVGRCCVALVLGALVAACPTPQSPKGPPPEYEEPAPPSWLDGGTGGTRAEPASSPPLAPSSSSTPPVPAAGAVPPQYILR